MHSSLIIELNAKNVKGLTAFIQGHNYVVKLVKVSSSFRSRNSLTNKIILNIPRGVLNMLVLSAAMFLAEVTDDD